MRFTNNLLVFSFLLLSLNLGAQTTRKVLFLGNSYTNGNNLPQLVKNVALSAGDTLIFDKNTPGGNTLENHSQNPTSINKIALGGWDYVVLQEQSQRPVTNTSKFKQGGNRLFDTIKKYNPCATPMLYMTWGRKNGDQNSCPSFPVMCTYLGMDSALRKNYMDLANDINSEVSPVSVVWRNLRQNNPSIELYTADESHPSAAGSYAAACSFYASIFKKDPSSISFNFGLNAADAATIRSAAKIEVFDSLAKWDYKELPRSNFSFTVGSVANQLNLATINPVFGQEYSWDFGDGGSSNLAFPTHTYAADGTYTIRLTTSTCDIQGIHTSVTDTIVQFCSHTPTISHTNSKLCNYDTLWTETASQYQWYANGLPIPENGQYLANYQKYNSMSFSVMSTVNGCSELSEPFNAVPPFSGFYFDAAWGGDPCIGDTALFIAKHINGVFPDSSLILWYKNGNLLSSHINQDTLRISSQGIYVCKTLDTNSLCPFDTTVSSPFIIDCGTLDIPKTKTLMSFSIYPNPAKSHIILRLAPNLEQKVVHIYNTAGMSVKSFNVYDNQEIDISALARGLYYVRIKDDAAQVLKFLKE